VGSKPGTHTVTLEVWLNQKPRPVRLAATSRAVFVEANARRLGRAGINEATQALRGGGLKDYFNNAGSKAKDRLRRPDQD
jgi:hypothetical protein